MAGNFCKAAYQKQAQIIPESHHRCGRIRRIRTFFIVVLVCLFIAPALRAQTAPAKKPQEPRLTSAEKAGILLGGLFVGIMAGGLIGTLMGNSQAYNGGFADFFRGAMIGACASPFLFYEYATHRKGMQFPDNSWYILAGSNATFNNYDASALRPGLSLGIGRNYALSGKMYMQAEAFINTRRFFLADQKMCYFTSSNNYFLNGDINFSVTYVDLSVLAKMPVHTFANSHIYLALGPSMAVQVLEKTDYDIFEKETFGSSPCPPYDFVYISDEPGPTSPYIALLGAIELEFHRLLLELRLHQALTGTNQIFPLINETRMSTLMLSAGYRFAGR